MSSKGMNYNCADVVSKKTKQMSSLSLRNLTINEACGIESLEEWTPDYLNNE